MQTICSPSFFDCKFVGVIVRLFYILSCVEFQIIIFSPRLTFFPNIWLLPRLSLSFTVQVNNLPVLDPGETLPHTLYSSDDLPSTVAVNLSQGSAIKTLNFHPEYQTLLLGKLLLCFLFS